MKLKFFRLLFDSQILDKKIPITRDDRVRL